MSARAEYDDDEGAKKATRPRLQRVGKTPTEVESSLKIGLVSDTHDRLAPELWPFFEGVECIFHAGDVGDFRLVKELETIAPVYAITGNTDKMGKKLPDRLTQEVGGVTFHLRHKMDTAIGNLLLFSERQKADLVLFGHTHEPFVQSIRGTLFVNPGSATKSRIGANTAAIALIADGIGELTVHDLVAPDFPVRMTWTR